MGYKETDHIDNDDFVMILQDGCIKVISYEEFISKISLGGFNICKSWLNCIVGIGLFTSDATIINIPPEMKDLYISTENRVINKPFTSDDFINRYFDNEGDPLGRIIITGGDVSGYSLNGVSIYIGQAIDVSELVNLSFTAKNQDMSYTQDLYFEAYDINNVKAISV